MKYIIYNDIRYIVKKERKIVLLYLFIIVMLTFLFSYSNYSIDDNIIIKIFGLDCNFKEFDWIEILSYIFSMSIFILLSFKTYIRDMKNNLENIFLRISKKRWIIYKLISIFISTFLILILGYLIVYLILIVINNIYSKDIIKLFTKNLLYVYFIQLISIIIYCLFKANCHYIFISIIISIFILNLCFNIFSIISINLYLIILSYLIFIILYLKIIIKKLTVIFEKVKEE